MMTKSIDGAIVDWLEEIPVDELVDEKAKMIVEQFRLGSLPVNEAIALLEQDCTKSMEDWIGLNLKYKNIFQ
jgi:hypothetical protein